jgi:hypothetical protein
MRMRCGGVSIASRNMHGARENGLLRLRWKRLKAVDERFFDQRA